MWLREERWAPLEPCAAQLSVGGLSHREIVLTIGNSSHHWEMALAVSPLVFAALQRITLRMFVPRFTLKRGLAQPPRKEAEEEKLVATK